MKINGRVYHTYKNIEEIDTNLNTPELIALLGDLYNEKYDNIFVSEGFAKACEEGLIPFKVCEKTHGTSDEYEYHHIAVAENDDVTVYSVLFKEND